MPNQGCRTSQSRAALESQVFFSIASDFAQKLYFANCFGTCMSVNGTNSSRALQHFATQTAVSPSATITSFADVQKNPKRMLLNGRALLCRVVLEGELICKGRGALHRAAPSPWDGDISDTLPQAELPIQPPVSLLNIKKKQIYHQYTPKHTP